MGREVRLVHKTSSTRERSKTVPKTIPIPGPGVIGGAQDTTVGLNTAIELVFTAEGVFWRDLNGNSFTGKLFQGVADYGDSYVSFTPDTPTDVHWRFLPADGSSETDGRILVRQDGFRENSIREERVVRT